MKNQSFVLVSVLLGAFVASCGSVSSPSDGGMTGTAGTGAAGTGTAGAGTAGTSGSGGVGGGAGHGGAGGSGTAGQGGTGGGTAGAGGGTAGTGGARPCVDVACAGACSGASCGGDWTCETGVACTQIALQYCGCDGKTFTAGGCAPRAYAYVGACDAGISCDTSKVLCKIAQPQCPTGQVPSVEGTCYGPCVPATSCTCDKPADCPNPDTTTCHNNTKRCGPFVN